MLPNTIETLDQVDTRYQAFYTTQGEGGVYTIDSELQQPNTDGLKNTNASLKNEKTEIKNELDQVKQTLQELQEKATQDKLLEKEEYTTLMTEKEGIFETKLNKANTELADLMRELVTTETATLATEIAGDNAALIAPHLVGLEYDNGIQYPDGLDREAFIKQFKDDPKFAPLTNAQQASGGGASSNPGGNTHVDSAQYDAYFDPNSSNYSPTKQYELQQENPELYRSLESKYKLDDPYNINRHTKQ